MVPREPLRGVFSYRDHPGLLSLSGFEQTRLFHHRKVPFGPLWYLTGLDLVEFGVGTATFRLPVTGWLRSAAGTMTGGVLAFAADAALGAAIVTTLGPRRVLATSDLALDFVRPPAVDCDSIVARAAIVDVGRAQGLAEATVADSHGRLLAHATARCVITEISAPLPEPPELPIPWSDYPGPHPFARPAEGQVPSQETWDRIGGLGMLEAWQRGELARTPLSNLIGSETSSVAPGEVTMTVPASPWFCTMSGAVYGGALALISDYALDGAVLSAVEPGTSWATLDLRLRFLRPVWPERGALTAHARVVHRGRRLVVTSAAVHTRDGDLAVLADASALLLPGRPWADLTDFVDEGHDASALPAAFAVDADSRRAEPGGALPHEA